MTGTARPLLPALAGLVALGLAGCELGPDYQRPAPPQAAGYTAEPLAATASTNAVGGEAQRFVMGQDIPGQWWTLFRSPQLDALIRQALAANPSLRSAQAALRQARELAQAGEGALYPSVGVGSNVTREKIPGFEVGAPVPSEVLSYTTATVQVSYSPDVFGGTRRQIESLEAQTDYAKFQLEATYLTLTANLVNAAVQEASLRAQIAATRDIIADETKELDVLQHQFELGGTPKAAVIAQEATLAQVRANLPPLQKALAQQRDLIAALAGRLPADPPAETFTLASLHLPAELPVSLPSKLVEQRPDVRAIEAQLHAASAQIGVAQAARFPQFPITADIGKAALGYSLFGPGSTAAELVVGTTAPIFSGGALEHQQRAAEANYDKVDGQYRNTVLGAFQNAADSLRALQSDADALRAQVAATRSAADSLDITRRQFELGGTNYVAVLDAQRTYQQARIGLVQAAAERYADTAALFQALGGGWWNRSDVAAAADSAQGH